MATVTAQVTGSWVLLQVGGASVDVDLQNVIKGYNILYANAATTPSDDFIGHVLGGLEIVPRTVPAGENLYVRHNLNPGARDLTVKVTTNA